MGDISETTATRLWRDRVQLREQERDEAQARAQIAEQNVASLSNQNDRLAMEIARLREQNDQFAAEIARLRALRVAEASQACTDMGQRMEDLRTALLSLIDQPAGSNLH